MRICCRNLCGQVVPIMAELSSDVQTTLIIRHRWLLHAPSTLHPPSRNGPLGALLFRSRWWIRTSSNIVNCVLQRISLYGCLRRCNAFEVVTVELVRSAWSRSRGHCRRKLRLSTSFVLELAQVHEPLEKTTRQSCRHSIGSDSLTLLCSRVR